jgi:hypothetical protein
VLALKVIDETATFKFLIDGIPVPALTRYLISQYFGKARVVVQPDAGDVGVVRLYCELTQGLMYQFSFSVQAPCLRADHAAASAELAARLAIAQAQAACRQCGTPTEAVSCRLRTDLHPWHGDLLLEPYGGATSGIQAAAHQTIQQLPRKTRRLR